MSDEDEYEDEHICDIANKYSRCYTHRCPYFIKNIQKCKEDILDQDIRGKIKPLGSCIISGCEIKNKIIRMGYNEEENKLQRECNSGIEKDKICEKWDRLSKCYTQKCRYYKSNRLKRIVLKTAFGCVIIFVVVPKLYFLYNLT